MNDVNSGRTVTIDMRIGGPSNNISEAYYRDAAQTANAFIVHQEMMAHHDALRAKGWPASIFDEIEAIVPAAGVNSYYNHFTGFINLVYGGLLGTGDWTNIPTSGKADILSRATDGAGETQTAERAPPYPAGATGYPRISVNFKSAV